MRACTGSERHQPRRRPGSLGSRDRERRDWSTQGSHTPEKSRPGRPFGPSARPGRALELRGRLAISRPPPSRSELSSSPLTVAPILLAFRLGIASAKANVGLQRANRFSDAYVLFQPYTYQNNALMASRAGLRGRWESRFRCPFITAIRATSSARRSTYTSLRCSWRHNSIGSRSKYNRRSRNMKSAVRSPTAFATRSCPA